MSEECTCRYWEDGLDLHLCSGGQGLKLDAYAHWRSESSTNYVHHVIRAVQRLERERREAALSAELPTYAELLKEYVTQPAGVAPSKYIYNVLLPLCRTTAELEQIKVEAQEESNKWWGRMSKGACDLALADGKKQGRAELLAEQDEQQQRTMRDMSDRAMTTTQVPVIMTISRGEPSPYPLPDDESARVPDYIEMVEAFREALRTRAVAWSACADLVWIDAVRWREQYAFPEPESSSDAIIRSLRAEITRLSRLDPGQQGAPTDEEIEKAYWGERAKNYPVGTVSEYFRLGVRWSYKRGVPRPEPIPFPSDICCE